MNWALWRKAVSDVWRLLVVCSGLLVLFAWAFVWFTSLFQLGVWGALLNALPNALQSLFGVPVARLATPAGQLSLIYVHFVTMVVCVGWAVGRGSDPISGEIGRGTMELLLTLPVRRVSVLLIPAVFSTLGAAVLAASLWLGTWLGTLTVAAHRATGAGQFLPGAVNVFALTFCLTGITALLSSWDHNRWRAMSLSVGIVVVSFLLRLVARISQAGGWARHLEWLKYATFLTAFEPQQLILMPDAAKSLAWQYHGTLIGIGLACYATGAVIFTVRDIPQPR